MGARTAPAGGTFLGIGLGPIQTGIFLLGARRGGYARIVAAEVDPAVVAAFRREGGEACINVAEPDHVRREPVGRIEVLNPADPQDCAALAEVAAEADEIATALPAVKVFAHVAPWLREGFSRQPGRRRFVYAGENHNHAAELLAAAIGPGFPGTFCLNTVIGKMSGIVPAAECAARGLAPLCPAADRGHLVEAFDRILIGSCPGIAERRVLGLHAREDLLPFEEAKLYGHNAVHFLLGLHGQRRGLAVMSELAGHPDLLALGLAAFIEESGAALRRKWRAVGDPLFTEAGFREYAEDLVRRMANPFLGDRIDRICRDLERKLGWQDRLVGTLRLALGQGVPAPRFAAATARAAHLAFGDDAAASLARLWQREGADAAEMAAVLALLACHADATACP